MALVLSDDQKMIRDSADGFFKTEAPVAQHRQLRDTADATGFDRNVWAKMADMGFAGVLVPEEHGGAGFGHVAAGLIMEAMGRNLSAAPMLSTGILGVTALNAAGTPEQQAKYLPLIAQGQRLLALAADEAARHNPAHVTTTATPSGNGFKLNGVKGFVLDGHVADTLIVAARTGGDDKDPDGITLFLVDAKAAGVDVERRSMVDSRNAARITLTDVQVDGADVLGPVGGGFAILETVLDAGRACLAAEMLGVSSESFDRTIDYLKQRDQFGVKIGSFQALQHRAAHLFCEVELARSATLRALTALDARDERATMFASLAKAKSGEVAKLATNEGVQMHGGIGMTDDFDIGFYMKRARAAQETFGDIAFHGDRLARLMGY
ncbi:acyl-CoA dehydrogenase family protein [Polymorphobacter fuscus]|uniref:Acyl-CoA dehydrogenase n=1 Tax=Sandarakinorhabdus fusca TaxID=1439888 RepID=A0A7C9GPZ3_9SPHN|nr:acyl-CoA dehydrogenase family protein [Polymorphobacter fuscus]KAB7647827.1 acyl-CoA dehydrogenase [Polymorphobacter fuscus]MQT17130.1 acyl-CoA dehydrogenase [Polymorphobacter fuscus]NJC08877.1 acyl-CoA dehydrogenase [Polymorphobacter fuscus]